jgi:hypothetical protein
MIINFIKDINWFIFSNKNQTNMYFKANNYIINIYYKQISKYYLTVILCFNLKTNKIRETDLYCKTKYIKKNNLVTIISAFFKNKIK